MISKASLRWILIYALFFSVMPSFTIAQGICNPDAMPPNLVNCPYDMGFTIAAGECGALVDWTPPYVEDDDCDSVNVISSVDFFTFHSGWGDGNNGQLIFHGTDSFTIVGTTNGTPGNGTNRFSVCFYSPCAGMLSFKWRARMNNGDGFISDRARLTIIKNRIPDTIAANVNYDMTPTDDSFADGDVGATLILPGDRFCIDVQSDNTDGVDSITIRDLLFVPLPIEVYQTKGPDPGSILPQGTYAVEYTATDCGGNTSYCNFTVTVLPPDPVDLIVSCPDDFTIQLTNSAMCDTLIDWAIPKVQTCGPVNGFQEEMNPFIQGVQLSEAAEMGMGDGIVGTDGIVYLNPAKDSLIIIGINNGTYGTPRNDTSVIQVCLMPRCTGTISFDWSAFVERFQNFDRDEAGIIFNGKDSILSAPGYSDNAAGSVSFQTDGINPLCFYVRSTNFLSEDTLTIRNFVYTPTPTQVIQVEGPDIKEPLEPGVYHFKFDARDCYGNLDTCAFNATIIGAPRGAMACKNLNVSLNERCEALITPEMLVSGVCTASMIVELSHYGVPVPNPVDSHYLGQHIVATVRDTLNGNSCWSDLVIEDKLAPVIICRADTTDCYSFNFDFPLNYNGTDCSPYTVTTVDERIEHFYCDSNFLKAVYRDILITDRNGLTDLCTDTIFVERLKLSDIIINEKIYMLSCDKPFMKDENGHPSPLEFGLPQIILHNGSYLNIWPLNLLLDCNLFVQYEDIDLGEINCVRKIMRTWKFREWFCGEEISKIGVQLFIIKDETGPEITHAPYGFEATTGSRDCVARVLLPSIEAEDACHNDLRIDVAYPGGILLNQNGGYVDLPVGEDTIYYRVYDGCYNLTEHFIVIHVKDQTPPVAVCDRNTVVGLNHSGYNWIPAEVFDDGSFDECSLHHFEVRRMDREFCGTRGEDDWGPEVGFCCEDVGKTIMVGLKAVDHYGNEAICMVNVDVQDKDRPLITCLPNITVDCRFDIDYNHLEVFGKIVTDTADREKIIIDSRYYHVIDGHPIDGIAEDNCPPTMLDSVDVSNINQCGLGYIIRIFQAVDLQGNRSDVCYQYITVINHESFDSTDIVWPLDLDTLGICNPDELIPERLHAPYDRPVVSDDECSLIGLSYDDVVFSPTLPGDPCFKIFRTWRVIDWCQRDIYGNIIIWSHTQVIKVINNVDPVITRISPDTMVCSYDLNCNPIPVRFSIEASDDCTPVDQMLYTYKIDFDGDGTIDVARSAIGGNVAEGTWPIGRHLVKWEVEDRCGNTAKSQFVLDLRNCKSPVAYCLNGLSTNLTPMDTNGDGIPDVALDTVWAKDFDAGSYHNCGYPVFLSFSPDLNDTYRVYNCDSIAGSGLKTVEMWVTDINGNTSFCRTFIDIQDNSNFCPPNLKNSNVDGLIETEKSDKVEHVTIALENSGLSEVSTDASGRYSFLQIPNGQHVIVRPSKTDGWLNGVSTADIVKIQRHILGLEQLNSVYKMIAADVNKSRSITAKDVSDLRKLILGLTTEITGNTSWRFVHQLYPFNDINTALSQNFPESYEINSLKGNMNLNFYAVKTGDVNESAATKGFNNSKNRNKSVLELQTVDKKILKDEVEDIEIRVNNGALFSGLQFTLQWNVGQLELISAEGNEELNIHEDHYSLLHAKEGKLSFSWNGELSNGDLILKLRMKGLKEFNLSDAIAMTSEITPALSVTKDGGEEGAIAMNFVGSGPDNFVVLQNEPNPWNHQTTIGMVLPEAGEVGITVYDLAGKIYLSERKQMNKGYNKYILSESQLAHSGVYYYQVDFLSSTVTRKMVISK